MHEDFEADREERRRRFLRNLPWLIPAVIVVGTALFYGLGKLVVWLWSQTLVDIFGVKAISFWQAWGLILLSQILFKANMGATTRTGRWRRRRASGASES
ncbi:MAG TPA: hypothetical protein VJY35_04305 [Candidatus Eisenbacteria bacterium]|nr:hypothetical protein [Candidatus Eisenbacteria bacterium]